MEFIVKESYGHGIYHGAACRQEYQKLTSLLQGISLPDSLPGARQNPEVDRSNRSQDVTHNAVRGTPFIRGEGDR
jgi:hypothetical protein